MSLFHPVPSYQPNTQTDDRKGEDLIAFMQKQNVILVKQQQLSQIPTKDIPVLRGDALHFKCFIRAFEQRTDDEKDKLYFVEQWGTSRACLQLCSLDT